MYIDIEKLYQYTLVNARPFSKQNGDGLAKKLSYINFNYDRNSLQVIYLFC